MKELINKFAFEMIKCSIGASEMCKMIQMICLAMNNLSRTISVLFILMNVWDFSSPAWIFLFLVGTLLEQNLAYRYCRYIIQPCIRVGLLS